MMLLEISPTSKKERHVNMYKLDRRVTQSTSQQIIADFNSLCMIATAIKERNYLIKDERGNHKSLR